MLEAKSLTSLRNGRLIQEKISFFLEPGSLLKITGPNGVGKSTILKMISGFLPIFKGSLFFDNNIINQESCFFKNNVCYLGHKSPLKENLTCEQNYDFLTNLFKVSNIKLKEKFNIKKIGNKQISECSEGQKKRVALSSILNENKRIWLLDEPFSNLDNEAESILVEILKEKLNKNGIILIVTHLKLPITNFKELKLSFPKKNFCNEQIQEDPFFSGDWE